MSSRPVVFLGSTLPRAEAAKILSADYRSPIRRGDLGQVPAGARVLIVDGEFDQSLSVSPKEILEFMARGGRASGAASMGALRAAELAPVGMRGIGWIYEQYRSGRILGDDEVAVCYLPRSFEPVTVPLINVRYWLEQLCSAHELGERMAARVLRGARRIFYADRTPERLRSALDEILGAETTAYLLGVTGGCITDIKARDARRALQEVGGRRDQPGKNPSSAPAQASGSSSIG